MTQSAMTRMTRYHPMLVAVHWALAFLIIAALALGALALVKIPNTDPMKIAALRSHMAGGLLIAVMMIARLALRLRTKHPPAASTGNAYLDILAFLSHRLFYALILGMVASGLVMALQAHLPSIVFAGRGALPADFWVFPIRYVHYVLSRLLMALIVLHIAGAFYHTFFLRDGLLKRMFFGRRIYNDATASAPIIGKQMSEVRQ
jgi:cytochrome b561